MVSGFCRHYACVCDWTRQCDCHCFWIRNFLHGPQPFKYCSVNQILSADRLTPSRRIINYLMYCFCVLMWLCVNLVFSLLIIIGHDGSSPPFSRLTTFRYNPVESDSSTGLILFPLTLCFSFCNPVVCNWALDKDSIDVVFNDELLSCYGLPCILYLL